MFPWIQLNRLHRLARHILSSLCYRYFRLDRFLPLNLSDQGFPFLPSLPLRLLVR
jgi:hypothetical protein